MITFKSKSTRLKTKQVTFILIDALLGSLAFLFISIMLFEYSNIKSYTNGLYQAMLFLQVTFTLAALHGRFSVFNSRLFDYSCIEGKERKVRDNLAILKDLCNNDFISEEA